MNSETLKEILEAAGINDVDVSSFNEYSNRTKVTVWFDT